MILRVCILIGSLIYVLGGGALAVAQDPAGEISVHDFVMGQSVDPVRLGRATGSVVWLVPIEFNRRNDGAAFELRASIEGRDDSVLARMFFERHARYAASLRRAREMKSFFFSQNYAQSPSWAEFQDIDGANNWPLVGTLYTCNEDCDPDFWGTHRNPMIRGLVVVLNDGTFIRGDFLHDLGQRGADLERIEQSAERRNPDCRVGEFYYTVSARCPSGSNLEIVVPHQSRSEGAFGESFLVHRGQMLIRARHTSTRQLFFESRQLHRGILDSLVSEVDHHVPSFTLNVVEQARREQDQHAVDPF